MLQLQSAVQRGIKEELGFDITESQISDNGNNRKVMDSMSYPGLNSIIDLFKFTVKLNDKQYNPDGYIENQEDKSTYFKWVKNSINEEYKPERNLSNFTPEEVQEIRDIFLDVVDEFSMQPCGDDGEYLINKATTQYFIGCYRNAFIEIKTIGDDILIIKRYVEEYIIPRLKNLGYKILHFKNSNDYDYINDIEMIEYDMLVLTITK